MSIYNDILQSVQTVIKKLVPCDVVVRKLPKAEENLDQLPLVAVTPAITSQTWRRASFQLQEFVGYSVQITIIAGGNRDFTTNIEQYTEWYELIRTAFKAPPLPQVPQVWKTSVKPVRVFDRTMLNLNYDYLMLEVMFTTIE